MKKDTYSSTGMLREEVSLHVSLLRADIDHSNEMIRKVDREMSQKIDELRAENYKMRHLSIVLAAVAILNPPITMVLLKLIQVD